MSLISQLPLIKLEDSDSIPLSMTVDTVDQLQLLVSPTGTAATSATVSTIGMAVSSEMLMAINAVSSAASTPTVSTCGNGQFLQENMVTQLANAMLAHSPVGTGFSSVVDATAALPSPQQQQQQQDVLAAVAAAAGFALPIGSSVLPGSSLTAAAAGGEHSQLLSSSAPFSLSAISADEFVATPTAIACNPSLPTPTSLPLTLTTSMAGPTSDASAHDVLITSATLAAAVAANSKLIGATSAPASIACGHLTGLVPDTDPTLLTTLQTAGLNFHPSVLHNSPSPTIPSDQTPLAAVFAANQAQTRTGRVRSYTDSLATPMFATLGRNGRQGLVGNGPAAQLKIRTRGNSLGGWLEPDDTGISPSLDAALSITTSMDATSAVAAAAAAASLHDTFFQQIMQFDQPQSAMLYGKRSQSPSLHAPQPQSPIGRMTSAPLRVITSKLMSQTLPLSAGSAAGDSAPTSASVDSPMDSDRLGLPRPPQIKLPNRSVIEAQATGRCTCRWDDCYQVFTQLEDLIEHISEMHVGSGKSGYYCRWESCSRGNKPFTKRHKMYNHLRTHTGERPFQCNIEGCGKRFSRPDSLATHNKTHSNVRPYHCRYNECGKAYYHARSLRKHEQTHKLLGDVCDVPSPVSSNAIIPFGDTSFPLPLATSAGYHDSVLLGSHAGAVSLHHPYSSTPVHGAASVTMDSSLAAIAQSYWGAANGDSMPSYIREPAHPPNGSMYYMPQQDAHPVQQQQQQQQQSHLHEQNPCCSPHVYSGCEHQMADQMQLSHPYHHPTPPLQSYPMVSGPVTVMTAPFSRTAPVASTTGRPLGYHVAATTPISNCDTGYSGPS